MTDNPQIEQWRIGEWRAMKDLYHSPEQWAVFEKIGRHEGKDVLSRVLTRTHQRWAELEAADHNAAAKLQQALEALRAVEYVDVGKWAEAIACPKCWVAEGELHRADCAIGAALSRIGVEA